MELDKNIFNIYNYNNNYTLYNKCWLLKIYNYT